MENCQSPFNPLRTFISSTQAHLLFRSVHCQLQTVPQKMRQLIFGLCLLLGANGGKIVNSEMWLKDVEAGNLPHLTPDQQRYLFGANIKIDSPPSPPVTVSPTSWWEDVEKGLLPPLSDSQQLYLFGAKAEPDNGDPIYPPNESYNRRSNNDDEASVFDEKLLSIRLTDFYSIDASEEGRGRLKKIVVPVILAMTIIAAILLPALMTVIKLIAVKGLWSGVVSLIISKLLGLKALLSHHHHHHSEDNRRPYFVYLPHGKHRREEEENLQGQRQPYDQWLPENYENWNRDGFKSQVQ